MPRQWHIIIYPLFKAHLGTLVCTGIRQNQFLFIIYTRKGPFLFTFYRRKGPLLSHSLYTKRTFSFHYLYTKGTFSLHCLYTKRTFSLHYLYTKRTFSLSRYLYTKRTLSLQIWAFRGAAMLVHSLPMKSRKRLACDVPDTSARQSPAWFMTLHITDTDC